MTSEISAINQQCTAVGKLLQVTVVWLTAV